MTRYAPVVLSGLCLLSTVGAARAGQPEPAGVWGSRAARGGSALCVFALPEAP